jgi:hypothetical protein
MFLVNVAEAPLFSCKGRTSLNITKYKCARCVPAIFANVAEVDEYLFVSNNAS